MSKLGLPVVIAAAAILAAPHSVMALCCSPTKVAAANQSSAKRDSLLVLDVSGMTCDGCAAHVRKALASVRGVKEAKASYAAKEARVRLSKPTAAEKELLEAVKKAGYDARVRSKAAADAAKASPQGGKPSS